MKNNIYYLLRDFTNKFTVKPLNKGGFEVLIYIPKKYELIWIIKISDLRSSLEELDSYNSNKIRDKYSKEIWTEKFSFVQECTNSYEVKEVNEKETKIVIHIPTQFERIWISKLTDLKTTLNELNESEQ